MEGGRVSQGVVPLSPLLDLPQRDLWERDLPTAGHAGRPGSAKVPTPKSVYTGLQKLHDDFFFKH